MKSTFKLSAAIVLCVAIVYSSCQKNQVNTTAAAKTTNMDAVASKIALSLSKSITGQYGGQNINDGVKASNGLGSKKGPAINGIYDICGVTIDTVYNTTTISHDTTNVLTGHFNFVYTCGAAGLDGYNVMDSITVASANATFFNTTTGVQKYIVKALDQQQFKLISMDGSLSAKTHNSILVNGVTTEYHDFTSVYILNGVQANLSGVVGDLTTGTASYTSTQVDVYPTNTTGIVTVYHGLITYLGNHMATLTLQINNSGPVANYSVNMLTGSITAI